MSRIDNFSHVVELSSRRTLGRARGALSVLSDGARCSLVERVPTLKAVDTGARTCKALESSIGTISADSIRISAAWGRDGLPRRT